jgi:hypothetical protein
MLATTAEALKLRAGEAMTQQKWRRRRQQQQQQKL